jgi:hypothetical protein
MNSLSDYSDIIYGQPFYWGLTGFNFFLKLTKMGGRGVAMPTRA